MSKFKLAKYRKSNKDPESLKGFKNNDICGTISDVIQSTSNISYFNFILDEESVALTGLTDLRISFQANSKNTDIFHPNDFIKIRLTEDPNDCTTPKGERFLALDYCFKNGSVYKLVKETFEPICSSKELNTFFFAFPRQNDIGDPIIYFTVEGVCFKDPQRQFILFEDLKNFKSTEKLLGDLTDYGIKSIHLVNDMPDNTWMDDFYNGHFYSINLAGICQQFHDKIPGAIYIRYNQTTKPKLTIHDSRRRRILPIAASPNYSTQPSQASPTSAESDANRTLKTNIELPASLISLAKPTEEQTQPASHPKWNEMPTFLKTRSLDDLMELYGNVKFLKEKIVKESLNSTLKKHAKEQSKSFRNILDGKISGNINAVYEEYLKNYAELKSSFDAEINKTPIKDKESTKTVEANTAEGINENVENALIDPETKAAEESKLEIEKKKREEKERKDKEKRDALQKQKEEAAERARIEREERLKRKAEKEQRKEAERQAKLEAKRLIEEKQKLEAEEKLKIEAEEKLKKEQEQKEKDKEKKIARSKSLKENSISEEEPVKQFGKAKDVSQKIPLIVDHRKCSFASLFKSFVVHEPELLHKENHAYAIYRLATYLKESFDNNGRTEFSLADIMNLLVCISQSYMTIIAGKPGVGKSSCVSLLAKFLGLNNEFKTPTTNSNGETQIETWNYQRFTEVNVAKNWSSSHDFIGYWNTFNKNFEGTKVFDALKRMQNDPDKEAKNENEFDRFPYWILLDEANLSPIEEYWSDFMNKCDIEQYQTESLSIGPETDNSDNTVKIPNTLRFLATINYDHTTQNLSERMLDRSWIITLMPNITRNTVIRKFTNTEPGNKIIPNEIFDYLLHYMDNFYANNENPEEQEEKECGFLYDFLLGDRNKPEPDPENDDPYSPDHGLLELMGLTLSQRVWNSIRRYCFTMKKMKLLIYALDFKLGEDVLEGKISPKDAREITQEYREKDTVNNLILDYVISQRILPRMRLPATEDNLQFKAIKEKIGDKLPKTKVLLDKIEENGKDIGYYFFFNQF